MLPVEDFGVAIKSVFARIPAVITAGAGNDGVEVNGAVIDLMAVPGQGKRRFRSAHVAIPFSAVLAEGATLTAAANLRTADDSGMSVNVADLAPAVASGVVATGGSGGSTETGCIEFDVPLTGARQYIQLQVTANLSAANTDTVALAGVIDLCMPDEMPPAA